MKKNKRLTIIILILLVIVISLISFVGIYTKNLNTYSNNLKNYDLGMEFEGKRVIKFAVDTSEEQVTYDADGNVIENHQSSSIRRHSSHHRFLPVSSDQIYGYLDNIIPCRP